MTLPWTVFGHGRDDKRPWSVSVERASGPYVLVSTSVNNRGAGVTLDLQTAWAFGRAVIAAADAIAATICPCAIFAPDPDAQTDEAVQVCECGHTDDEHAPDGTCQAGAQ